MPLVVDDPWLSPYENDIEERAKRFDDTLSGIVDRHNSLLEFANAYTYFGCAYDPNTKGWSVREWLPGASQVSIIGGFNNWDKEAHKLEHDALLERPWT